MGALDISIIGPALPAIRESFGIDDRAAAWMLSIYVLFNLIGTPLMAKLSDRYGRRPVYVADVASSRPGSLLVALAPSYGLVLTGRAVQGLGAGGIFPVASAVIGDVFPPHRRGAALGPHRRRLRTRLPARTPSSAACSSCSAGPGSSWSTCPSPLAVIIGALRLLPGGRVREPRPFDVAGMAT
jgi:hypothetical protein